MFFISHHYLEPLFPRGNTKSVGFFSAWKEIGIRQSWSDTERNDFQPSPNSEVSPLPESSKATSDTLLQAVGYQRTYHFLSQNPSLQRWFSQSHVNKALFGGRQTAWVLNRVNVTTILQILKWRWLHQIVSNYRKYHFSNACFSFINFDTGQTENK